MRLVVNGATRNAQCATDNLSVIPSVRRYNLQLYKIAFSLYSSILSIRYFEIVRSSQFEKPEKEKRRIERKAYCDVISYFIVPYVGPKYFRAFGTQFYHQPVRGRPFDSEGGGLSNFVWTNNLFSP